MGTQRDTHVVTDGAERSEVRQWARLPHWEDGLLFETDETSLAITDAKHFAKFEIG